MLTLSKKQIVVLSSIVVAVVISFFYYKMRVDDLNDIVVLKSGTTVQTETIRTIEIDFEQNIKVYVIGEVNTSGVYELPRNSRVVDAIEMAGGATEFADLISINLARIIKDEEQIVIPRIKEESVGNNESEKMIAVEAVNNLPFGRIENRLVNINKATKTELATLPNIGSVTAQNIIDYRELYGDFKNITDIKKVTRIGDKTYDGLKDLITVN